MAVFVHICDLMFLDDSSFHYEPYYEVVAGEVPNLYRITLVTQSPIIKAQPDILFRFPLFVSHAGVRSLWLPVAPCGSLWLRCWDCERPVSIPLCAGIETESKIEREER